MRNKIKIEFDDLPYELDSDGYPTDDYLNLVGTYNPENGCMIEFMKMLAKNWQWSGDYSDLYRIGKKYYLELHTGGWSGNEDIIRAISKNKNLRYPYFSLEKYRAGGHYVFISCPVMYGKDNRKDSVCDCSCDT